MHVSIIWHPIGRSACPAARQRSADATTAFSTALSRSTHPTDRQFRQTTIYLHLPERPGAAAARPLELSRSPRQKKTRIFPTSRAFRLPG